MKLQNMRTNKVPVLAKLKIFWTVERQECSCKGVWRLYFSEMLSKISSDRNKACILCLWVVRQRVLLDFNIGTLYSEMCEILTIYTKIDNRPVATFKCRIRWGSDSKNCTRSIDKKWCFQVWLLRQTKTETNFGPKRINQWIISTLKNKQWAKKANHLTELSKTLKK